MQSSPSLFQSVLPPCSPQCFLPSGLLKPMWPGWQLRAHSGRPHPAGEGETPQLPCLRTAGGQGACWGSDDYTRTNNNSGPLISMTAWAHWRMGDDGYVSAHLCQVSLVWTLWMATDP